MIPTIKKRVLVWIVVKKIFVNFCRLKLQTSDDAQILAYEPKELLIASKKLRGLGVLLPSISQLPKLSKLNFLRQ